MSQFFPEDAFKGVAQDYAAHRLPYPQALLDHLLHRSKAAVSGRLLDLGCGPGRVALALAPKFHQVIAVDPEAEMTAHGAELARQRGHKNLVWMTCRAESLGFEESCLELITIGEAFHRLDQALVARAALQWLRPGHCLATLGCMDVFKGQEPWEAVVREVTGRWKRDPSPAGWDRSAPAEVFSAAGFEEGQSHAFQVPHVWTVDSIIGYCYSTSVLSRRVLGKDTAAFEADLRKTLLAFDVQGHYAATMNFGYTLVRKPLADRSTAA